jgi:aromatic-L-amino-acid decarboxylase
MNFTASEATEEGRSKLRTVDADAFRKNGTALIEMIANYMETIGEMPVTSAIKPGDIRRSLPEHPPLEAESFSEVFNDVNNLVLPSLTNWQHPSFFAFFPSNISYPSILAELLAAGLGQQGMSWVTSPACTEMETLMLDWMQELLGLPEGFRSTSSSGGGVIQGTASEATLCSIIAARWRITQGAINNDGDTSKLIAYASSQAHSRYQKFLGNPVHVLLTNLFLVVLKKVFA